MAQLRSQRREPDTPVRRFLRVQYKRHIPPLDIVMPNGVHFTVAAMLRCATTVSPPLIEGYAIEWWYGTRFMGDIGDNGRRIVFDAILAFNDHALPLTQDDPRRMRYAYHPVSGYKPAPHATDPRTWVAPWLCVPRSPRWNR